jgi:hypothetical protein
MTEYKIIGRVLGEAFENPVYPEDGSSLEDIIDQQAYIYTEGSYGCDCNKRLFSGLYDEDDYACGDEFAYEVLDLITPQGLVINLLEHERFKED